MTNVRVQEVVQRIEASLALSGRSMHEITLLVVTKNRSLSEIQEMYDLGFRHFAENRPEMLRQRQEAFPQEDIIWHLIGNLQRRKIGLIDGRVDYFHALDRLSLVQALDQKLENPMKVFLEVNISGEANKHGFHPDQVFQVFGQLLQVNKLQVMGLMTMAPYQAPEDEIRHIFASLRGLSQDLKESYDLKEDLSLSMGMSQDFELALAEGADYIRIGTAWFEEEESHHGIIG